MLYNHGDLIQNSGCFNYGDQRPHGCNTRINFEKKKFAGIYQETWKKDRPFLAQGKHETEVLCMLSSGGYYDMKCHIKSEKHSQVARFNPFN